MPWRRIISWTGLLAVGAAAVAVWLRRLRPDLPVGAVERRPDDGTVTLPSDGPPPRGGTDSVGRTPAEKNDAMERRWWALIRVRYLPPFIKRYARRRVDTIAARDAVRYFGRQDPTDNQNTRIPEGEEVHVPAIWLTELYTPTTLAGLRVGPRPESFELRRRRSQDARVARETGSHSSSRAASSESGSAFSLANSFVFGTAAADSELGPVSVRPVLAGSRSMAAIRIRA